MAHTLRRRGAQFFDDDVGNILHRLKRHCREARNEIISLEIAADDTSEVFENKLAACRSACSNLIVTAEEFEKHNWPGGDGAIGDDESMCDDDDQDEEPDLWFGDEDGMAEDGEEEDEEADRE